MNATEGHHGFRSEPCARQYHSLAKPAGVKDLGEEDDCSQDFNPQNNFYYIPGQKLAGEIDLYDPEQGNYEEMPAKLPETTALTHGPTGTTGMKPSN